MCFAVYAASCVVYEIPEPMKIICSPLPIAQYRYRVIDNYGEDIRNVFLQVKYTLKYNDTYPTTTQPRLSDQSNDAQTLVSPKSLARTCYPKPAAQTVSLNLWFPSFQQQQLIEITRRRTGFLNEGP